MSRRVVVTGLGLVSPLGTGVEKSWSNLCSGKSGIDLITRFDTEDFAVKIAAEVKDFDVENYIDKKTSKHLDFFVQYDQIMAKYLLLQEHKLLVTPTPECKQLKDKIKKCRSSLYALLRQFPNRFITAKTILNSRNRTKKNHSVVIQKKSKIKTANFNF